MRNQRKERGNVNIVNPRTNAIEQRGPIGGRAWLEKKKGEEEGVCLSVWWPVRVCARVRTWCG